MISSRCCVGLRLQTAAPPADYVIRVLRQRRWHEHPQPFDLPGRVGNISSIITWYSRHRVAQVVVYPQFFGVTIAQAARLTGGA
jgi:hypothetical protein